MTKGRKKKSETLTLSSDHACNWNFCRYIPSFSANPVAALSRNEEFQGKFLKNLNISVIYNFPSKIVNIYFDYKKSPFKIQSVKVRYEFLDYLLSKTELICVNPKFYQFSVDAVNRHVLHERFGCKITFSYGLRVEFKFHVPYFQTITKIKFEPQEDFNVPEEIVKLFNEKLADQEELRTKLVELPEAIKPYVGDRISKLSFAVNIEDLTEQREFSIYKMYDVMLHKLDFGYRILVDNKAFLPPNVFETFVRLIPYTPDKLNDKSFEAEVNKIYRDNEGQLWIEIELRPLDEKYEKLTYTVVFVPNRISFIASQKALDSIVKKGVAKYFENFTEIPRFNNQKQNKGRKIFNDKDFNWFNKNIESNEEQKMAIKNIVNRTSFPFPFCIFGPPGTGKTSCLVECILQILTLKPNSKILVTAQSNSACNEIGERLLKFITLHKTFRLYSAKLPKVKPDSVSKELILSSTLKDKKRIFFPTLEQFKHFPIIISTLMSSFKLGRTQGGLFQNYFDYIFIDECAATTEPEACVPILGLGCGQKKITAGIVLVGDPKQLPPVIKTSAAAHLDLNVSLIERVMKTPRYKANPDYDSNYIVQLLDNYRSHPAILHFSNVEFYESKLRAKSTDINIMLGTKWEHLKNKNFPVLFHHEDSKCKMRGTSSYNAGEIKVVKLYIDNLIAFGIGDKKITPEDIGVVTPYKAQADKLKKVVPKEVEVGTTEYYQGREKLIMIISTVKSKTGVGFLADERRLNVCLTRAKALMIIVGNAETLQKNALWRRFVDYCHENDSYVGQSFVLKGSKMIAESEPKVDQELLMIAYEVADIKEDVDSIIDDAESDNGIFCDALEELDAEEKLDDENFEVQDAIRELLAKMTNLQI